MFQNSKGIKNYIVVSKYALLLDSGFKATQVLSPLQLQWSLSWMTPNPWLNPEDIANLH